MNWNQFCRSLRSRNVFIALPLIWLFALIVVFSVGNVFHKMPDELNAEDYHHLNDRLTDANRRIEDLMKHNRQLSLHLKDLNELQKTKEELMIYYKFKDMALEQTSHPTSDYELSRRRVRQNVDDLWHYLRQRLNSSSMEFVNDLRYSLQIDFDVLDKRDNQWRRQQLKSLGDFVQQKVQLLQNPEDCRSAKKLVCDLNKSCGFSCQMHHSAHCLVAAMALNRTLILNTNDWRSGVWNKLFKPLSLTCLESSGFNKTQWGHEDIDSYQVIYYPIIDYIEPRPNFLPLVIPQQISHQLIGLSGEPFIWFIGQVIKYLMRPSDQMQAFVDEFKMKNRFNHPIVGIHVRRTDKIGTEAKFHSIDEYMFYVEDFYNKLDLTNERNRVNTTVERLVYLATDEPQVWKTEIKPFLEKGYVFTGDVSLSETADPSQRDDFDSLHNVIVDLLLLSQCDYIVCTFSSQICRMAFELMQTRDNDKDLSNAYYSLDDIYYFGGQVFHGKLALMNHKAQNEKEISFRVGDILGIANNMHDGYNFGDHNQNKKIGLYPRFKVTEFVESKPFAIFE